MKRQIERTFLHILTIDQLKQSTSPGDNFIISLEEKPTIDLCKFLYKEVGRDFFWRDRLKWSDRDWLDYLSNNFF